jgi:AcrR family transcriptional regulator
LDIQMTSPPVASIEAQPDSYQRLRPGPGQSRLEVAENQRARLQRAIIELTAEHGVGAITVRRLTKLAGVSNATFYSQFAGTDDCLLAAYRGTMAEASRRVAAARTPELGSADQVDRALRSLLGYLLIDPEVARFALVEIYGGGPMAFVAIADESARLESALRGCMDRRSRRFPRQWAAPIFAASFHCARARLVGALPEEQMQAIEDLMEWARDFIEGREEAKVLDKEQANLSAEWDSVLGNMSRGGREEQDLILAAILRLASPDGFRGLTPSKVSSAAGVPVARYRRHFASVADGYLTAIRRTCRAFFIELTSAPSPNSTEQLSTGDALERAFRRAAMHPVAAQLTFHRIVEPGIAGITCRDSLISELAAALDNAAPGVPYALPVRADAHAATVWARLAMAAGTSCARVK